MSTQKAVLFIGAHHEEIEASCPILPCKLAARGLRVVILNPIGGWNWCAIKQLGKGAKERIRDEALKAARALGCEKIIWDYPVAEASSCRAEITRRFAELLTDINPAFVFMQWPRDSHADHRLISQISYHALQQAPNIVEAAPELLLEETFAFQSGMDQTCDFWPDFLVLANAGEMKKAEQSLRCFTSYGDKWERWWNAIRAKTAYWEYLTAGGGPAEAYKFLGPRLPIKGLALAEFLGEDIRPVINERWCFGKDFFDISAP